MPLFLEDDQMCYACGRHNPQGLKINFEHPKKGTLKAAVVFSKHHQGFKNIVHGGMMALVLDEIMVNLAWREGIPAMTGELFVRLKKAAKIGQKVHLEGHLEDGGEGKRVFYAAATAKNDSGELLASAKATCIRIKDQDIKLEAPSKSS
ncbi:MAG: hypothetical protein A3C47_03690 [Omnitrophica bacterium RIFCSPHIGHO2_02_FULL_51_18]|nr:MAG: hypothetical protein A3C47_03690 [Omnitrophica bacterium RIFCSPHIGHO2_02_FULL_51_18]